MANPTAIALLSLGMLGLLGIGLSYRWNWDAGKASGRVTIVSVALLVAGAFASALRNGLTTVFVVACLAMLFGLINLARPMAIKSRRSAARVALVAFGVSAASAYSFYLFTESERRPGQIAAQLSEHQQF